MGDAVRNIDAEIPFKVPDSWVWVRLGACFNIVMGASPNGNAVTHDGVGMEFHQGKIYFSEILLQCSNTFTSEPSKIAPAGAVLLCVRAPVGVVNIADRVVCIGRGLAAIEPVCEMTSLFAYYWLRTLEGVFCQKSTGSTFAAITADTVKEQLIPLPPLAEQAKIIDTINHLYRQQDTIAENLN